MENQNNNQYTDSQEKPLREYYDSTTGYVQTTPSFRPKNTRMQPIKNLSTPARICMWIVGSIAGITIIFTCVLVWIIGLQYLGIIEKKEQTVPQTVPGDTYNYFIYDDSFGSFLPDGGGNEGDVLPIPDIPEQKPEDEPQSEKPGLGITITELTLQFTIENKYTAGLVLVSIEEYSSFAGTDVRVNDLIVAINGMPTPKSDDLLSFLQQKSVGDEVTVTVARYEDGVAKVFDVTVNLIAMPE